MNYIKLFEDGTSEAVDVKPSWGMYEKEHALDNREVYIDGNWYTTTGGELVANGTFDTDISGWTAVNATVTNPNNKIRVANTNSHGHAYTIATAVIGTQYSLKGFAESFVNTNAKITISHEVLDATHTNTVESFLFAPGASSGDGYFTFIAKSETLYLSIAPDGEGTTGINEFDNISVFKTEPTLAVAPNLPHSYLSKKGKLLGVEVAGGVPVDIHYDELAPTLVEDTIKTSNLVVTDGFDLGQSWVDVASERALGITYPNDTGKPIKVAMVLLQNNSSVITLNIYVNDEVVSNQYSNTTNTGKTFFTYFSLPDKATYKILGSSGSTIYSWKELR